MNYIQNSEELEFAVFCIENIAARLGAAPQKVHLALTEQSRILNDYIIANYGILHTQSKDYIVNDILQILKEEGISI